MKFNNQSSLTNKIDRRGATLSEVLISLLVMSVGVVSLATLFPISVLRTVQATQLTNATNLRYNVEALLGVRSEFYNVGTSWQSGYAYGANALAIPMELTALKSPPVVFICTTAGTSGGFEPAWNFTNGGTTNDGTAVWTTVLLRNYVVDPLGEVLVESAYRQTANGDFFGNDGLVPPTPQTRVRAFTGFGSPPSLALADDVASLPDSWMFIADSTQFSLNAGLTSCTMTDLQDYITSVQSFQPVTRAVFFDSTGKVSYTRQVSSTSPYPFTNLNSQTVNWTAPLPSTFTPSKVKIEMKDRRYTWLLSIRRAFSGVSYMDVVVFFKRPFSGKDEQLYPATFTSTTDYGADLAPGVQGVDDDGNGITDFLGSGAPDPKEIGWPGSDDTPRNWVVVQYDSTGDRPFIKKGGFVTDVDNLRWYRVIDVVEGDILNGYTPAGVMQKAGLNLAGLNADPFSGTYSADATYFANTKSIFLRIEGEIAQTGLQPAGGLGGPPQGRAMMMRGVIDVYPIRTHLTWEN